MISQPPKSQSFPICNHSLYDPLLSSVSEMSCFRISNFGLNVYYVYLVVVSVIDGASTDHKLIDIKHGSQDSGTSPGMNTSDKHNIFMTGLVQIHYSEQGMICSGALLTNWIVLLTALCVEGLQTNKTNVIVRVENSILKIGVEDINIDPNYREGNPENNLAILIIYGRENWTVGNFLLPEHCYSTDVILDLHMRTYVYQWRCNVCFGDCIPHYVELPVTRNFTLCGCLPIISKTSYYCVDRRRDNYEYKHMDFGTPIYYWNASEQYILGLYTGLELNDTMPGVLYQYIYPGIDWIKEQIDQHPIPPQY